MSKTSKLLFFAILLAIAAVAGLSAWGNSNLLNRAQPDKWSITTLENSLEANLTDVHWQESEMTGKYKRPDGTIHDFVATVPEEKTSAGAALERALIKNNVYFQLDPPPVSQALVSMFTLVGVPILILGFIWFLVVRPSQMGLYAARPYVVDMGRSSNGIEIRLFVEHDSREGQSLEQIMSDLGCGPEETIRRLLRAYPGTVSSSLGEER